MQRAAILYVLGYGQMALTHRRSLGRGLDELLELDKQQTFLVLVRSARVLSGRDQTTGQQSSHCGGHCGSHCDD